MSVYSKQRWAFPLLMGAWALFTQCTPMEHVKFVTKHRFEWDAAPHECEVATKHGTSLASITINGKWNSQALRCYSHKDTLVVYPDYTVLYIREKGAEGVMPVEITGEWFTIKKTEPYGTTMHFMLDENKENTERSLILHITTGTDGGEINIRQKGKDD